MFEKLEELAKNNKKISDFHIRSGSPLPIMSYGGSSMLATMMGISIVMSAKIYQRELIA